MSADPSPMIWVIKVTLPGATEAEADTWLDAIADVVHRRDPGFLGLVSLEEEPE